jgi:hypothetical protein
LEFFSIWAAIGVKLGFRVGNAQDPMWSSRRSILMAQTNKQEFKLNAGRLKNNKRSTRTRTPVASDPTLAPFQSDKLSANRGGVGVAQVVLEMRLAFTNEREGLMRVGNCKG